MVEFLLYSLQFCVYAGVEGIDQVEDISGGGLNLSFQVEEVTEDIFQKSQVAEVQEAEEDLAGDEASRQIGTTL